MNTLQVLMPMGGLGSRFSDAGFTTPKPLIEVDDMPMFRKALTSLKNIDLPKAFFFVIRKEHADNLKLDKLITDALPSAQVIIVPELTRGAAETALAAQDHLDPTQPLVVMDCDLWFSSESYNNMVTESLKKDRPSAGVLTFTADNPRYSYAKIDENNRVIRTAEKVVISNNAITGAYFYSNAKLFIDSASELLTQPISESMQEYYLSHTYNILINRGVEVTASYVDKYVSFGTPEELAEYTNGIN